ncbi:MAG TPA: DUF1559 domain-containing protein, partial [Pirellulaceae bacterium]|nr:DUF1559 domain-containing protein [Pirellulaceae bacterium]
SSWQPIFPSALTDKTSIADFANGDGASNTLLFTENTNAWDWYDPLDRRDVPNQYTAPTDVYPNQGNILKYQVTEYKVGVIWVDPNQVSQPQVAINREMLAFNIDWRHARPAAFHPEGFMMCMADGSVRFVSETVNLQVYAKLLSHNGRKCRTPGIDPSTENTPTPTWQGVPITADQLTQ